MVPVISASELGKSYPRNFGTRAYTIKSRVLSRQPRAERGRYWALRGIALEVHRGQAVGVVGPNGAGKSTLLRLLGQVGKPSEGHATVRGRIGALLEIGAGLTNDLTGMENVFLLGTIAGMRRSEVRLKLDEIIEFSELGAACDNPVRSYSTGMRMRLAFSVAIHCDPDVLLVDEALAVGDSAFQAKCLAKVKELRSQGTAIFFVSHDLGQVEELCDHVLYLKDGRVERYGRTEEVMSAYKADFDLHGLTARANPRGCDALEDDINRFRTGQIEIMRVENLGSDLAVAQSCAVGEPLTVRLTLANQGRHAKAMASIAIQTTSGFTITEAVTSAALALDSGKSSVELTFPALDLVPGAYRMTAGIYHADWSEPYDLHIKAYPLIVSGTPRAKGLWNAAYAWRVTSVSP